MGAVYYGRRPKRWERIKDRLAVLLRNVASRLDGTRTLSYCITGPGARLVSAEARDRIETAALKVLMDGLVEEMRYQRIEQALEEHYRGRQ